MLAASFMLPKYLCAALSWHGHVCAYTPMSAKSERDMYKSSMEKIVYTNRAILKKLYVCCAPTHHF